MGSPSLFLKDPDDLPLPGRRHRRGRVAPRARPCPGLPAPERDGENGRLLRQLPPAAPDPAPPLPPGPARRRSASPSPARPPELTAAATRRSTRRPSRASLRSVRAADRRLGLLNLFWLAHTATSRSTCRSWRPRAPALAPRQVLAPPAALVLLPAARPGRAQGARTRSRSGSPRAARTRPSWRRSSTTGSPSPRCRVSDLDFNQFLAANKRYRHPAEVFFEIQARSSSARPSGGSGKATGACSTRVGRHLPGLPEDQLPAARPSLVKIVMNGHDPDLPPGRRLERRGQAPRPRRCCAPRPSGASPPRSSTRSWTSSTNAKRFEIVSQAARPGADPRPSSRESSRTRRAGGLRVYEFGESAQVLNNAVNATVLFLDLRGFTQTSEGQISERDLTRELYAVFDEFVPIVERFGGHGGQVPRRRHDGHLRAPTDVEPARPPERRAHRHPLPGDAGRQARAGARPTSRWGSPSTTAASTSRASSTTRRRSRPR